MDNPEKKERASKSFSKNGTKPFKNLKIFRKLLF